MISQAATCSLRNARPKSSGDAACIIHYSVPANATVATAESAKSACACAVRRRNKTNPCTTANVKHAAAIMDQMTVTQFTV